MLGVAADVVTPSFLADTAAPASGLVRPSMASAPPMGSTPTPTCRVVVSRPPISAVRRRVSWRASRRSARRREASQAAPSRIVL
jgi:hypothetical protein